jgi:hypothetical protein
MLLGTSVEYYNQKPILLANTEMNKDKIKYNGRINILEPEDKNARFKMFEKISIKNKATEYREPLTNVWENNVLAQVYFSEGNIQIIQNALRKGVFDMSKYKYNVPNQNIDSLKIIMRSIYLQNARHHPDNITEQVETLNALVLDYAVPFVFNETQFYLKYLEDQSTLVMPFAKSQKNDRVYKQLEPKFWF